MQCRLLDDEIDKLAYESGFMPMKRYSRSPRKINDLMDDITRWINIVSVTNAENSLGLYPYYNTYSSYIINQLGSLLLIRYSLTLELLGHPLCHIQLQ